LTALGFFLAGAEGFTLGLRLSLAILASQRIRRPVAGRQLKWGTADYSRNQQ
jgi:hypothetical protein